MLRQSSDVCKSNKLDTSKNLAILGTIWRSLKAYIDQLWFFWLAPVSGAIVAGILGRGLFRKP
jgi:hypothetical protein